MNLCKRANLDTNAFGGMDKLQSVDLDFSVLNGETLHNLQNLQQKTNRPFC